MTVAAGRTARAEHFDDLAEQHEQLIGVTRQLVAALRMATKGFSESAREQAEEKLDEHTKLLDAQSTALSMYRQDVEAAELIDFSQGLRVVK